MDFINSVLLNITANVGWPDGFWSNIISSFYEFIGDYGLTLIIFTICLKFVLLPLDFWQRKQTRDSSKKQAKIQPKLAKLQAKYKNNQQMLNTKTMELYKAENYNIMTSCLSMLVTMGLTLVIFITLFGAMKDIAAYKMEYQYEELQAVYDTTINNGGKIEEAEEAVINEYDDIKEGFLWINNIWKADTYTSIIPTYEEYTKTVKDTGVSKDKYNEVMSALQDEYEGEWNGLFILVILAGVVTFISQKIIMKSQNQAKQNLPKKEGESDVVIPNLSFMTYLLPGLMVMVTWGYSAAFALYIVTNSIFTTISTIAMNKILDSMEKKKEDKNKIDISYSRDI